MTKEPEDQDKDEATYVVLDHLFDPQAAGPKASCLAYVADKLDTQCELTTLVNPSSYRLVKVKQL